MKLNPLFLLVFICASYVSVSAQDYSFKVLVSKGKNEVKSSGSWQPLKVGTSLTEKDEIRMGANSYVGLVHKTGKPLELKDAKPYKVAELAKQISAGASVVTKYTDFILSSDDKKSSRLGATGAVDRGGNTFQVYLPKPAEQSVFYNDKQIISWDKADLSGPFVVTFNSLFEDELLKKETTQPFVEVDLNSREFQNEDNVKVVVISKDGKKSEEKTLKRLSKQDRSRIEALLKEVSSATEEETALNKYILAAFYEENRLYIDAATYYVEAIRLAPDPSIYQQSYESFLLRTGLRKPATK